MSFTRRETLGQLVALPFVSPLDGLDDEAEFCRPSAPIKVATLRAFTDAQGPGFTFPPAFWADPLRYLAERGFDDADF